MKVKWQIIPWYAIDWEKVQRSHKSCVTKKKYFRTLFFAKRYAFKQAKKNSECIVIELIEHPCTYYVTWGNRNGVWSPITGKDIYSPLIIRK